MRALHRDEDSAAAPRRARRAACCGCGARHDGAGPLCPPCRVAPAPWMRVTARFLLEEMGVAA